MRHAVIMAGGVGTRLWPVSRTNAPKQFQKLIGDKTLIEETFDRLSLSVDPKNIWVITTSSYCQITQDELPKIDPKHIIGEPEGRNTAPAVGYATLKILQEDPEALISVSPADHYIGKVDIFNKAFNDAYKFLSDKPEYLVTIGIKPTEPHSGYGYIKMGDKVENKHSDSVFSVEKFVEKPNTETAKRFLESQQYLWNGGYYFFSGSQIIKYFEKFIPGTLKTLQNVVGNNKPELYKEIPKESIDTAIAERIDKLVVIPADLDWSDIGNWSALHDILESRGVVPENHLSIDTVNTMVVAKDRLIATIGMENCIIVDTGDALLVCNKEKVQSVKDLVDLLKDNNQGHLL
jgi:mannose-1-phosphate guanylyltransferase